LPEEINSERQKSQQGPYSRPQIPYCPWLDADGHRRRNCQLGWAISKAQDVLTIKVGNKLAF